MRLGRWERHARGAQARAGCRHTAAPRSSEALAHRQPICCHPRSGMHHRPLGAPHLCRESNRQCCHVSMQPSCGMPPPPVMRHIAGFPQCVVKWNMQTGVAPWTDLVLPPFSLITADADLVNSKGATVHTHPQLHAISRMPGKQLHLPSTAAYSVQPGAGLARVAFHSHLRQLRTFANTRSSHDQFGPSSRLQASG